MQLASDLSTLPTKPGRPTVGGYMLARQIPIDWRAVERRLIRPADLVAADLERDRVLSAGTHAVLSRNLWSIYHPGTSGPTPSYIGPCMQINIG